jgi:hypothetical protein
MSTLLVFRLTIQSSYAQNAEQVADADHFDTVQWWLAADHAWRIKTFAMDEDIHCHHIGGSIAESFARESTERNYGDVIATSFSVELNSLANAESIANAMREFGGAEALEVDRNGGKFAFWNPLQVHFSSKSQPQ